MSIDLNKENIKHCIKDKSYRFSIIICKINPSFNRILLLKRRHEQRNNCRNVRAESFAIYKFYRKNDNVYKLNTTCLDI